MSIPTGTRLGSYEILAALGTNTKLDRDVAIKILSPAFASDADRLARFEREAKMLAALNHPHIAQIYGLAIKVLPIFSPDGRWIAYASNEAGGGNLFLETYVRPFPGPGGKWRVSSGGGGFPKWSAASRELLFVKFPNVMLAPYEVVGDSFRADKPQLWSPTSIRGVGLPSPYDIHPDGKRLAVVGIREQDTAAHDTVVFVFNSFDELRRLAPLKH